MSVWDERFRWIVSCDLEFEQLLGELTDKADRLDLVKIWFEKWGDEPYYGLEMIEMKKILEVE